VKLNWRDSLRKLLQQLLSHAWCLLLLSLLQLALKSFGHADPIFLFLLVDGEVP